MGTLSEQDRMVLRGLASTVSPATMAAMAMRDFTNWTPDYWEAAEARAKALLTEPTQH